MSLGIPAFANEDIGKEMSIEGDAVTISGKPRNVKWTDAEHHDCSGKIKSVEEENKGKVRLENGQEFENAGIQNYVFTERSVMKAETVPVHPTTSVFGILLSSNSSPLQNDENALRCAMKSSKSFLDLVKYSLAFLLVLLLLAGALMRSHYGMLPEIQCLYHNHTFAWYLEPNTTAHLLLLCN